MNRLKKDSITILFYLVEIFNKGAIFVKKTMTILISIIVIITLFFIKFYYKKIKYGNNISNKTAQEVAQYILDINSYEANEEVIVKSNKNTNKYIIYENCSKDNNLYRKEIIEPENLAGINFTYDGKNLKIENSRLNLTKLYERFPYIGEENTSIFEFIKNYKEAEETKIEETDEEIIISVKVKNSNQYIAYKKLYISKNKCIPTKLEIQNLAQKQVIYILYNEIKVNNLQKEDVISFNLEENQKDI